MLDTENNVAASTLPDQLLPSDTGTPSPGDPKGSRRGGWGVRRRVTGAASPHKVAFAREQRAAPTNAAQRLWEALRGGALGVRFRRQHPIGDYVLDFYCERYRLAVEIDGPEHAACQGYDRWRDETLARLGIKTLRFKPDDIDAALSDVIREIRTYLHPPTLPTEIAL